MGALNDGGLDPGLGLHFDILNDEFLLEGDGFYSFLDFMFGFRVTSLAPNLKIKDNSLSLTDAQLINTTSLASVFIEEKIYTDDTQTDLLGVKDVELSEVYDLQGNLLVKTTKLFDTANFNPRNSIYVTKNILLEAELEGEFAILDSFEQRFSQTIPEPHSIMLWCLGLLLLIAHRHHS